MSRSRGLEPQLILPTLLIAVSYFLLASLGQILAIPPGKITLIWPPSGLAFAAVLLLGTRALPGVFLGAVLSNILQGDISEPALVLALLIAVGSSLQPLAGRVLYTAFGVGPAPFAGRRSALGFIATVLLMTLVSSTWGTAAMSVRGALVTPASETWVTWWIGDAAGALVITPPILALFRQAFETHRGRFLGLSLVMAGMSIVIVTTAIVLHYAVYFESQRARLHEQAVNQARYLQDLADAERQRGVSRTETDLRIAEHFRIWDGEPADGRLFVLGEYQDDGVRYLQRAGTDAAQVPESVPLTSARGEPMRRALAGERGSMIGLDAAGRDVLAAYEPVPGLKRGLVVEQEMTSIRRPFMVSAAALASVALVLILSGVYWVQRLSSPIIANLERKSEELQQQVELQTRELRESEQQFRSLLDSTPEAMVIINAEGVMLHTNRKLAEISGYTAQELAGQSVDLLVPEAVRSRHKARRDTYYQEPVSRRLDERIGLALQRKDGATFPVAISLNPIEDARGLVIAASIRDISEQRAYEEALRQAKHEAEVATEAKANFLASMSHEIRTPMNAVIGMVDLLRQTELNDEQKEMLRTVSVAGQSLLTIINDILDLSKIEAGRLELEKIPFSLLDTLEGAANTVSINAQKKGLVLVTAVDPAIPASLIGDPVRVRQILINLMGNAIKFTERGKIVAQAKQVARADDRVTIRLEVQDEGIGIGPEAMANLFTEFSQAEASTTRKYGGTGLGLSICKRLSTMMGGTIGVDSEPGRGSTFHAELPLGVATDWSGEARPLEDLAGVHVMLVTQDEELAVLMQQGLQAQQARVSACMTLNGCIDACAKLADHGTPVDVVVIGYEWPRDEQRTLIAKGRRTSHPSRFIALSPEFALKTRMEDEDTLTVGAVPLTTSGLVHAVAVCTGRASPEVQHPEADLIEAPARLLSVEEAAAARTLVLVAEDNPTNRDVIGRQLRMLGHTFEMAENGKDALEAWRSGRYTVLLTDCHMPVMDGFDLTAAIRTEERVGDGAQRFPVVAITANALQGEAERCLAAGMDAYMSKPIDIKELRRMLKRFIPNAGSAEPASKRAALDNGAASVTLAIDPSVLKGIFGDDEQMFRDILGDFVAPSQQIVGEIQRAATARSGEGVKQGAHKLKSAARSIGANRLADICLELEKMGAENRLEGLAGKLAELIVEFGAVVDEIDKLGTS